MSHSGKYGVSIIMPCFNAGKFVRDAVQSVADHIGDSVPFEIILVDDGSDKKTRRVIEGLAYQDRPYLKTFILEQNKGQSTARNFAIGQAQYDYILPVDADDLLTTDLKILKKGSYPQRAIEALERDSSLAFVTTNMERFGAEKGDSILASLNLKTILLKGGIPVCSVVRKNDALQSGGYPEAMDCVEDWGFHVGLLNGRLIRGLGLQMMRLPENNYLYRQHDHAQNVNARLRDKISLRMVLFEKHPFIYRHAFKRQVKYGSQEDNFFRSQASNLTLSEKFRLAKERPYWALAKVFEKSVDVLVPVIRDIREIMKEHVPSQLFDFSRVP